jgi:hypothetical protein
MIVTVALDQSPDDIRPYIEAAAPTHPSLVDTEHVLADRYGMINVPTAVWIDERGTIARLPDTMFPDDKFVAFHGLKSELYLDALRAWVKEGKAPMTADELRRYQTPPSREQQLARAEFAVAWHLQKNGEVEAADRHFVRAGELAPLDWTIRRGSMPIRGLDPMGEPFIELYAAGTPTYNVPPLK